MSVLGPVLLAIGVVRLYNMVRTLVWIKQYGAAFREQLDQMTPQQWERLRVQESVLDRLHADYFPVGVKSYRLRRWSRGGSRWWTRALRWQLRLLRLVWVYYIFTLVGSAAVFALADVPRRLPTSARDLIATFALLLLLMAACLTVEQVMARRIIGAWGVGYHGLPNDARREGEALGEIVASTFAAVAGVIALAANLYFLHRRVGGFTALSERGGTTARLSDALYHALPPPFVHPPSAGSLLNGMVYVVGVVIVWIQILLAIARITSTSKVDRDL